VKVFQVIAEFGEWEDACRDVVYTSVAASDEIALAACRGAIEHLRSDVLAELRRWQAGIICSPNHQTVIGRMAYQLEHDVVDLAIVAHPVGVLTTQRQGTLVERVTLQSYENLSLDPYQPVDQDDPITPYHRMAEPFEEKYCR
jgi:hypothetical protein